MAKFKHYYLIRIAYLGYRLHGWQKQPDVKTIHHMIDRTLRFVFKHDNFKTLGSSRTDAMVSANDSAFELFLNESLPEDFASDFQRNLPPDIYFKSIQAVNESFNIIQSVQSKTYRYYFCCGSKPSPLCASILAWFPEEMDMQVLNAGLELIKGEHNFKSFCTQPKATTNFERSITRAKCFENKDLQASFFPEKSYCIEFKSKGFVRNQVRLMVGALYLLATGKIELQTIAHALKEYHDFNNQLIIAPASGLHLHRLEF